MIYRPDTVELCLTLLSVDFMHWMYSIFNFLVIWLLLFSGFIFHLMLCMLFSLFYFHPYLYLIFAAAGNNACLSAFLFLWLTDWLIDWLIGYLNPCQTKGLTRREWNLNWCNRCIRCFIIPALGQSDLSGVSCAYTCPQWPQLIHKSGQSLLESSHGVKHVCTHGKGKKSHVENMEESRRLHWMHCMTGRSHKSRVSVQ